MYVLHCSHTTIHFMQIHMCWFLFTVLIARKNNPTFVIFLHVVVHTCVDLLNGREHVMFTLGSVQYDKDGSYICFVQERR